MAVCIPTLDAWDQFVWPPSAAIQQAATEVEQCGYHCGNAIDLSPVMPVMEFRVTDEEGAYLCAAQALIFEGSILAYNPTRDKAEGMPTHEVTDDLSWVEEKSVVVLANFVPCIPQEADRIVEFGTHRLLGWSNDSSLEEDDEQMQEEDDKPEGDEHKEAEGWGEAYSKLPSSGVVLERGKTELEVEPR